MPGPEKTAEVRETAVVPSDSGARSGQFGRWKPTIYWYTPILMVLAAALLIGLLTVVIRRLGRAAEKRYWSAEARRQAYSDRPFRTGPRDA
jgi:hypothetical protein